MEFKKAEQIHDIIEALRHYENEYIRFTEQYESISGHLNDGVNGIGFTWKKTVNIIKQSLTCCKTIFKN